MLYALKYIIIIWLGHFILSNKLVTYIGLKMKDSTNYLYIYCVLIITVFFLILM